jgi:hypothetical protein
MRGIVRRVKEQSHKDEMSRALRGDFERLRGRGVSTTLAPRDDDSALEAVDDDSVTEAAAEAPSSDEDVSAPGWLGRLLGR